MAGFVEELMPREKAIAFTAESLGFPWQTDRGKISLAGNGTGRLLNTVKAPEDAPPYTRSTRDGYALRSADTFGAGPGAPAFLRIVGEVPMGSLPEFTLGPGECAVIHTGGILPGEADAVLMAEDADTAGSWIEARSAVQRGENLLRAGEEFSRGSVLLPRGTKIDWRTAGLLSMAGADTPEVPRLRIILLSTGDEIVPSDRKDLPPGKFRDVNSPILSYLLRKEGYESSFSGIIPDRPEALKTALSKALSEGDVIILSGGSSVSVRDYCSSLLSSLPSPGLLVRGILMSPGKPTLIAGMKEEKKLVLGLPGHPFSCFVTAWTVLLPLLSALIWGEVMEPWRRLLLPLGGPLFGHTGMEEFVPCTFSGGKALPSPIQSSFSKALYRADGLFHLPPSCETLRSGEEAEVWLW
ncbi:MAG: molybdopterin molybdotransferase MoeA [Synergistaceae bacterium]|nr:molybdopterin molybdotransferase MoeA [Synergistaceae bacterium]